jgi:Peptidase C13 family
VGRLIDAEEDIVLIYLSSHGSADYHLYVNFPPLVLQQLTPIVLHRMLNEAGIKWKVVVVSACYSGGYVEPLKDPYTLVITSSRADRTSFGCDNASTFTYFGQAYFQEALKKTTSFVEAFELARAAIAERERAEGLTPSEPQIYVGNAIRDKLGSGGKTTKIAAYAHARG